MEKTQAWKESVNTNFASLKAANHCSTGGCILFSAEREKLSIGADTLKGLYPNLFDKHFKMSIFKEVSSRM